MICRSDDMGTVSGRQRGAAFKDKIMDATYRVVEGLPKAIESVDRFKSIVVPEAAQIAYAETVIEIADKKHVEPGQLSKARRDEDRDSSAWATFQKVQENLVKGGLLVRTDSGRRAKTRPIKSVQGDLRINKGLWMLTEKLAEILGF